MPDLVATSTPATQQWLGGRALVNEAGLIGDRFARKRAYDHRSYG